MVQLVLEWAHEQIFNYVGRPATKASAEQLSLLSSGSNSLAPSGIGVHWEFKAEKSHGLLVVTREGFLC